MAIVESTANDNEIVRDLSRRERPEKWLKENWLGTFSIRQHSRLPINNRPHRARTAASGGARAGKSFARSASDAIKKLGTLAVPLPPSFPGCCEEEEPCCLVYQGTSGQWYSLFPSSSSTTTGGNRTSASV